MREFIHWLRHEARCDLFGHGTVVPHYAKGGFHCQRCKQFIPDEQMVAEGWVTISPGVVIVDGVRHFRPGMELDFTPRNHGA